VAASNPVHDVSVVRDKPFCPENLLWEFASRDVDSDEEDDGEDRELIDLVDYNVYLTRRLQQLTNRTHLTLSEVEGAHKATVLLAPERAVLRRSRRIA
jgi:hypothetical protein